MTDTTTPDAIEQDDFPDKPSAYERMQREADVKLHQRLEKLTGEALEHVYQFMRDAYHSDHVTIGRIFGLVEGKYWGEHPPTTESAATE